MRWNFSKMNERVAGIIKQKMEEGGTLVPVEKEEILGPYSDWGNCLRVVFTHQVFAKILEFFTDLSGKRLEHIMDVINTRLSEAEAGLLIMKDEDRMKLQFPADIEVFLVTPPSMTTSCGGSKRKASRNRRRRATKAYA
jgi:hypothetical protein